MALTLAELLDAPTKDEIRDKLFAGLNVQGFPITSFGSGSVCRTVVEATGDALEDFVGEVIPRVAGGGLVDEAKDDWLTLLAYQKYQLERILATYTVQSVTFTAAGGAGPYTVNAGDLVVQSTAGLRYILSQGGTIPSGGSVVLQCKAESPGAAYVDAAGTITTMVTALAGVTCTNASTKYSAVAQSGSGTGTVTPSCPTTPSPTTFSIRIDSSGQSGVATFSYSQDGGLYVSGGLVPVSPAFSTLPGGTRITFANGAVNPSFIAGAKYTFSAPGSPIVTQGIDDENDPALRLRCKARWPALAEVLTEDRYALWAKAASIEVTKVRVKASNSDTNPGQVDVLIAGPVNPLSGTVQTTVQDYLNLRAGISDKPVVTRATSTTIAASGTVYVRAEDVAAVQVAAQAAWNIYVAGVDINGVVRAAALVQALMDAGAVDVGQDDVGGTQILVGPGGGLVVNYQLGASSVAVVSATPLSSLLTWALI